MRDRTARMRKEWSYAALLLPALIGYLVFFAYPLVMNVVYSLTDLSRYRPHGSWVGLENYVRLFHDEEVLIGLKNSFIFAILTTVLQLACAIPLAVVLDMKLKTVGLMRLIFVAPSVLSSLVIGYIWLFLMSPLDYGLLNRILLTIGLDKVNWLGDPDLALYSIILTQVWQWTGWAMLIVLANLQSIPKDLYEAAEIDGAGGWSSFWRITLPLLAPSVTMNAVLTMISGLRVFDVIFSMTKGGPGHATESITTVLISRGFNEGQYGYASAFAMVFFVLILLVVFLQLRLFRRWEKIEQ